MNKFDQNGAVLIRQQYMENEWQTNKAIGLVSLGFVVVCIVTQILLQIDYSYGIAMANLYIFFPICFINGICYAIAWKKNFRGAWIKYMLMGGIVVMSVGLYFVFTVSMAYFVLIPIFVSTRYFNKTFIHQASVATIILFLIASVLNILLEPVSETIQLFHQNACYNCWSYHVDAIVYIITPMLLTIVFVMLFSLNTSNKGRKLLKSQGESAGKIAAVEAELNMASEIQKSALPDKSYICPNRNFRVAAEEIPAKVVGGDFYDYFMADEHTLAVLIADVSDKGIPAAMFMMSSKKAIQCAVECCHSLKESIKLANSLICSDNKSGMFLTLWLGIIDTRTGMGKYINAGHISPAVRHSDCTVSIIKNDPDIFIGNFPDMPPRVNDFRMEKGDVLLLYTDGLTDAMNGEKRSFGIENVISVFETAGKDAENTVEKILAASEKFSGEQEQFDDITLLALECLELEEPESAVFEHNANREGTAKTIDGVNVLLLKHACPEEERRNIDVVVDELCANISDYAYDGETGQMRIEAKVASNYITLSFIDSGLEFDPLGQGDPEFSDEPMMGGLGIYFVKNLVDEISYRRAGDKNVLTVTKLWNI